MSATQPTAGSVLDGLLDGARRVWQKITERVREAVNGPTPTPASIRTAARSVSVSGFVGDVVSHAENAGASAALEEAGITFSEWRTVGDERVRATHSAQHAVVRPTGEAFPNGQRFPGDRNAPTEEWAGCRCWLVPVEPASGEMP